ncbi:MAG: hypothetical protein WAL34_17425, partial [Acidobacteriaceae bacterium]
MSDRSACRPVPPPRTSAHRRTYSDDETNTQRGIPAPQPAMSDEERDAIREVRAEDARRSRVEHGFPELIEVRQQSPCSPRSYAPRPHP